MMEEIIKQAKAFMACIDIRLIQDKDNSIKFNENNEYIPFSISLTNPTINIKILDIPYIEFKFTKTVYTMIKLLNIIKILILSFFYKLENDIYINKKYNEITKYKIKNELFQYNTIISNALKLSG